jgi:hypothetical protein
LLSYNSETNKIKEEGGYRERKRSRRKKRKKKKSEYQGKQQGEMVDDQRANQTAKPLKEGKQKK